MSRKSNEKKKRATKQVEFAKLDHKVAALWTRVSSEKQEQNNCSLETQDKVCREYAERNGITIKKPFGGTHESAKKMGEEFKKMITEVRRDKEINVILVYSYDRFSRTGAEASMLKALLKSKGVYVVSATQPVDPDSASGDFMEDVLLLFSKFDNTIRKDKCVGGMKECLRRGEWFNAAPFGYDHYKENKHHYLKVNWKGELLRKAFRWKADEGLSNPEICDRLKAHGLEIDRKKLSYIFMNPIYCGYIRHNLLDEGELVKGNHEPIVDEETFKRINGASKAGYEHKEVTESFPLKRHVRCADCGGYLTGYVVKSRGKEYYKCNKIGCKNNQSVTKMHNKYIGLLDSYGIPKEFHGILKKVLVELFKGCHESRMEMTSTLNKKKTEIENKIKNVQYRFGVGEIGEEVYNVTMSKLKDEQSEITQQLESITENLSNKLKYIDAVVLMCCKLGSLWSKGNFHFRQNLQKLVFPDGVLFDKKIDGYRTEIDNAVFDIFRRFSDTCKNNKGTAEELLSLFVGAARLERATACTPCKNASRLHHAPMKSAAKVQKISIHQH